MKFPQLSFSAIKNLACLIVFIEVVLVFIGWQFGLMPWIKSWGLLVPMNPMTAVLFFFSSLSLWLDGKNEVFSILRKVCAAFVFIVGAIKISDCVLGTHGSFDHLLFSGQLNGSRMAPNTALGFMFMGAALLSIHNPRRIRMAQVFNFLVLMIGWVALLGYIYSAMSLYLIGPFFPMSLPAAFSFIILSIGIFASRAHQGLTEHLNKDSLSGKLARLLLSWAIVGLSLLGWGNVFIEKRNWVDAVGATAFFVVSNILFFCILIWYSTRSASRYEEKANATMKNLDDFFNNAAMGLHWVNEDGIILKANRYEMGMLGYASEEYVGHKITDFYVEQDVIKNILDHLKEGRVIENYEAKLRCKDGSVKHVQINSNVLWKNGKFVHTRCFTRDVTKQKQAEESLREKEASLRHLAAIIESSQDAIISKDIHGTITSWNKAAESIFGYTPQEMIGKSILTLIPSDRRDEEREILRRIQQGEKINSYETVRRRKDGSFVDISLTVSPLRNEAGEIIGASKIARDITERKKTEKELIRSNNELEQFAHIASHDLQEPLHLINSFVGLFIRRCQNKLDEKEKEYLGFIQQGSNQARALIKELLEYSSIGKARAQDLVSLTDVLEEVQMNLKLAIEESRARVLYGRLPDIKARHVEMVQLFQNLVSNAIKYRKEDPVIEIVCSRSFDGKSWVFSVSDNGIGIDPQFKDRIFGMFERLQAKSDVAGTGIGLAICKKIVEHQGGKIWVDSELGKGSTFHFIINAEQGVMSTNENFAGGRQLG